MNAMTAVKVLVSTRVSDDGINLRRIVEGTEDEVPSVLFDGLKAEGYVIEPGDEPVKSASDAGGDEPVAIPADWRDLHFMKQIHLAKQFDPSVARKDEAIVVLEAAEQAAKKAAAEAPQA